MAWWGVGGPAGIRVDGRLRGSPVPTTAQQAGRLPTATIRSGMTAAGPPRPHGDRRTGNPGSSRTSSTYVPPFPKGYRNEPVHLEGLLILITVIDQLQREYTETRDLLSALQQHVVRLEVGPEWSSSLQRLVRELADQLEHAVDQVQEHSADQAEGHDEEPTRFGARPSRLR